MSSSGSILHGLVVPGHHFPLAYAIIVGTGLVMALVMGMRLHFSEIVKTHCGTPEYWPSISATTGDFAPERFIWRTAFVLCALFRFTTGFLTYKYFAQLEHTAGAGRGAVVSTRSLVVWELVCELLRCASAIGWTIISSGEDNLHHNASFAVYMIVGFVLQASQVVIVGRLRGSYASGPSSYSVKRVCLLGQSVCAVCVGIFYARHHQTCAPGAYSRSTMCEWMFALFNVVFDASQAYELQHERVTFGVSGGEPHVFKLSTQPSEAVMFVSDAFFGMFTVSSMMMMMQTVYFVPMVAMELTWEVVLLFGLGVQLIFFNKKVRRFFESRKFFGAAVYVWCYVLSLVGLFCFDVQRDSGKRIVVTSIAPISLLLALYGRVYCTPSLELTDADHRRFSYSIPVGFAISMCLRIMFISVDPLFVSPMYNAFLGLVFGGWCAFIQYRRAAFGAVARPAPPESVSHDEEEGKPAAALFHMPQWLLGVGIGGGLSLGFMLVSQPGVVARLVGLEPFPMGIFLVCAYIFGLWSSPHIVSPRGQRNSSSLVDALASASTLCSLFAGGFLTLYFGTRQSNRSSEKLHAHFPTTWETPREHIKLSDWVTEEDFRGSPVLAYLGGMVLVFGIGVSLPVLFDGAFNHLRQRRMRKTFAEVSWWASAEFWATIIIFLSIVMQVYVVCFPFVPGGELLRNRLDFVMTFLIVCTVLPTAVCARAAQHATAMHAAEHPAAVGRVRTLSHYVVFALVGLLFACSIARIVAAPDSTSVPPGLTTMHERLADVLGVAKELGDFKVQLNKFDEPRLSESFKTYSSASIHEKQDAFKRNVVSKLGADVLYAAEQLTFFTAMIWTIHFGLDNYNVDSNARMVEMIRQTGAGVIGLLESDSTRVQTNNRDNVEYIAHALGYEYTDYGPTTFDGTFGCALITKYPILYSRRYVLPSPLGELACLIHAKLDLMGVETQVYVGHWGNTQHWADGILQSEFLGDLVQKNPGPSVFLGYLVTKPQDGNYFLYSHPTQPGKLRDTALQLYKQRQWRRLTNLGGFVESVAPEDRNLPEVEQQYRRPPEGADPRYFFFEETQRYSTAHPRWEYKDRYCQYILYKTGLPQDEKPEHHGQLAPYHFELIDWWRVLDIHELSDTEIQVVQLALRFGHEGRVFADHDKVD